MSDEDYGIDEDFVNDVQDATDAAILKKQLLDPKKRKETFVAYKKHITEQKKLENVRDRTLFIDDYGATICLIRTPDKVYKRNNKDQILTKVNKEGKKVKIIANLPKITKNKNFRMWGFQLLLIGNQKNTMFANTKKDLIGYGQTALVRGSMDKEYKVDKGFAMSEKKFIPFMSEIYKELHPEREVNSLADIDYSDYFDDYTFNIWETLIHFQGGAK